MHFKHIYVASNCNTLARRNDDKTFLSDISEVKRSLKNGIQVKNKMEGEKRYDKTCTGLIKHGLIKHGLINHGLRKYEFIKHGLIKH